MQNWAQEKETGLWRKYCRGKPLKNLCHFITRILRKMITIFISHSRAETLLAFLTSTSQFFVGLNSVAHLWTWRCRLGKGCLFHYCTLYSEIISLCTPQTYTNVDCQSATKRYRTLRLWLLQRYLFVIVVLGKSTLWHLQKFLQCITYIVLEFTPSSTLLYLPPSPHSWNTFNSIIFAFTYMCL
jgi:hypothetical protein